MEEKIYTPLNIIPDFGRPMRYMIFGTGENGKARYEIDRENIDFQGFIDTYSDLESFCGLPVYKPADYIAQFGTDSTVYVITSDWNFNEIVIQLKAKGVNCKYLLFGGTGNEDLLSFRTLRLRFEDPKSLAVFDNRFMYNQTNDEKYVSAMTEACGVAHINETDIPHKINVIYGFNNISRYFYLYERTNIHFTAFIVEEEIAKEYEGIPIYTLDEFYGKYRNTDAAIYITGWWDSFHATEHLKNNYNVPVELIVTNNNSETLNQYYDVFPPCDDESFIDAGCYDGYTTKRFFEWCGGKYSKVWAFEPEPDLYKNCAATLSGIKNVSVYNKALYSESNGTLPFVSADVGSSHIGDNGNIRVELAAIDDIVGDERVTFIKADIEGAEYDMLLGAEKTIKREKPKLAICVYHKPDDIIKLTGIIYKMNPDYRFALKHYTTYTSETVLYAY
jgi:FkbM family methyltransferase